MKSGVAAAGLGGTISLGSVASAYPTPKTNFSLKEVYKALIQKIKEEIGSAIPLSTTGPSIQSVAKGREQWNKAIDPLPSPIELPFDLCTTVPHVGKFCAKDPLQWIQRATAKAPESCNTHRRIIRFGLNAIYKDWVSTGWWPWDGHYETDFDFATWLGVDTEGCLWAGYRGETNLYSSPEEKEPGIGWAFENCGGPICPEKKLKPVAATVEETVDACYILAKNYLEGAIDTWNDLPVWVKGLLILLIAIAVAAIFVFFGWTIPAAGSASTVGALLA